jgi:DNA-binding SARP family transcriptional activator
LGCWAAWAVFAASIVVETPAAVRGRTARRIPMAGPLQALASSLVAAVLLTFAPMTPRPHPQAGAPLPAALTVVEPTALARPDLGPSRAIPAEPPAATHRPATQAAPAPATPRRYTVKPRDTLWGIAERELSDPFRWHDIYRRNKDRPQPDGGVLTDPDLIRPGWTLELPASTAPLGSAAGQAPAPTKPQPTLPAHQPSEQPPTTPPRTTEPTGTSLPAPQEGSRPQPPSQPAGPGRPSVKLPSGAVVGLSLAGGIAVALTAARLHQRRRRRLGEPRPGITHADPLATPTVQRLRRAARASSPPDADGHASDPSLDRDPDLDRAEDADATISRAAPAPAAPTPPGPQAPVRPGVVAIGQHNDQEVTVDLTDGGLGLDGPTAPQAVRAVIVALLAAQPQADAVEVLVTGQPLAAQLLGDAAPTPGLGVVADLDTALSTVEVEMIHRLRLLQGHDAPDVASYLEVDPAEPLPTIVLVTDPADDKAGWAPRLAAVLAMGRRLSIGALLVGPIPGVATLTLGPNAEIQAVQPDIEGALRGLVGGCAFTLGQAEAAELLAVVAAGRGTHPDVPPEQSPPEPPGLPAAPPPQAQAKSEADRRATPEERPVRVRLFGPLRIELDGVEVRSGLRTTSRELLAFLLLHPDGVRRETATEALWPDMDPARSAGRAKDALRSLRQTLQDATGQPGATVVELIGDRLRVNPAFVDADVWRFQAALAAATATTDTQTKLDALTQAAAAYGGTLLEGADYDWAEAAREELRRQAADVAGRLAELREQVGDLDGAIAALEDGARWDAYNEELHQRIMRLQAQLGRLDAVRRTYVRLQERLADLGADPDEATERLLHELRRGTTTRR